MRILFQTLAALVAVAVVSLGAMDAWAQESSPSSPSPADVEKARDLYVSAVEAVKADRHAEAADLFRESWKIIKKPELLYNEAVSRARAGQNERALDVALQADAADLPPDFRIKNTARIRAWRMLATANVVSKTTADSLAEEAIAAAEPTPEKVESTQVEPPGAGMTTGEIVGISLTITGVAALATAGILELQLSSQLEEVEKAAKARAAETYRERVDKAERIQLAEQVLLVSGAALVVGGVIVWLLSGDDSEAVGDDGNIAVLQF